MGILAVMILFGAVLVGWTLVSVRGDHTQTTNELAFLGFAASVFLTGISTVYCGLTGFILLESRRMRIQAVMPHVQVSAPVRSPGLILVELQNAGSAPAVDIEILAWVLKLVGGSRTPEPAAIYVGSRAALPATAVPQTLKLVEATDEQASSFATWKEHLVRAGVADDSLDVHLLLVAITYTAVDGTEMSECIAMTLGEQQPLPAGPP